MKEIGIELKICSDRLLDEIQSLLGKLVLHFLFTKNGSVSVRGIMKKVPNLQIGLPAPVPPTALTIKAVYLVRYSWNG